MISILRYQFNLHLYLLMRQEQNIQKHSRSLSRGRRVSQYVYVNGKIFERNSELYRPQVELIPYQIMSKQSEQTIKYVSEDEMKYKKLYHDSEQKLQHLSQQRQLLLHKLQQSQSKMYQSEIIRKQQSNQINIQRQRLMLFSSIIEQLKRQIYQSERNLHFKNQEQQKITFQMNNQASLFRNLQGRVIQQSTEIARLHSCLRQSYRKLETMKNQRERQDKLNINHQSKNKIIAYFNIKINQKYQILQDASNLDRKNQQNMNQLIDILKQSLKIGLQKDNQIKQLTQALLLKDSEFKFALQMKQSADNDLLADKSKSKQRIIEGPLQVQQLYSTQKQEIKSIIEEYEQRIAEILGEKNCECTHLYINLQKITKQFEREKSVRQRYEESIKIIFGILESKIELIFNWRSEQYDKIKKFAQNLQSRAETTQSQISNPQMNIQSSQKQKNQEDSDEEIKKRLSTAIQDLSKAWQEAIDIKVCLLEKNSKLSKYSSNSSLSRSKMEEFAVILHADMLLSL